MKSLQKHAYDPNYRSVLNDMMNMMGVVSDVDRLNSFEKGNMLPIDVYDSNDMYTVVSSIPGADLDNIDVRVEDGYMYIEAVVEKDYKNRFEGSIRRRERQYGTFSRKVKMPTGVSGQGVTAEYDNGLLIISIPKPEETRPHAVPIRNVSKLLDSVTP